MKFIKIPKNISLKIGQQFIELKGPNGKYIIKRPDFLEFELINKSTFTLKLKSGYENKKYNILINAWINNFLNLNSGLSSGYIKVLKINGIGYKLEYSLDTNELLLKLGWSNWHKYDLPKDIQVKINQKTNLLYIFGNNKQVVGQTTSQIRAFKKPEPYKGKGLSYINEVINLKEGKRNNV